MSERSDRPEPRHVLPPEERVAPEKAAKAAASAMASAVAAGAKAAATRRNLKEK